MRGHLKEVTYLRDGKGETDIGKENCPEIR